MTPPDPDHRAPTPGGPVPDGPDHGAPSERGGQVASHAVHGQEDRSRGQAHAPAGRLGVAAVEFPALLAFWLVLSGHYDALSVGMGVASAALVTAFTNDLVARSLGPRTGGLRRLPLRAWRFCRYGLWVLTQVPPAGLLIAYYVLHPRMPVEPCVLRFRTGLASQVARTMLANTITLIPGTLTIAVEGQEFTVHAFVPVCARVLVSAELQNRVAGVFLQDPEEPPEVEWQRPGGRAREAVR